MSDHLKIRGARTHNLKNISLDIPKNRLIVFTGLSGSGKSSLAFDTIYAEGQRRYVESLSSYARQFLGVMDKPDVDSIEGLSPAISIDQKSTSHNPRSTVGTVTEIYDYLRLLFARIGHPHCPVCGLEVARQSVETIVNSIITGMGNTLQNSVPQLRFMILSPIVRDRKGEFSELFDNLRAKGYQQIRLDQQIFDLGSDMVLIKTNKHTIEVVIDKIVVTKKIIRDKISYANLKSRLNDSVEQATNLSDGLITLSEVFDPAFDFPKYPKKFKDKLFSEKFACPVCNLSLPEIEPRTFSFNSPHGACATCSGIGSLLKIDETMIFNPNLSVSEGGILPYSKMFFHETWWSKLIHQFADENNINLRIPLQKLSLSAKNLLLKGTGSRIYKVKGKNRFGIATQIYETFPGLIADLEKRYSETESDFVRFEIEKFMRKEICPDCHGARLKKDALNITVNKTPIINVTNLPIDQTLEWINNLAEFLTEREQVVALPIIKEINVRLNFLTAVGLEYLTLARGANTLSGGEAQRIRLASQIGSGLSGVLYVLDEPSIGLHPRDNQKLITTLKHLRDLGNTVIVVEHDREVMENSDCIYDFGPGAGLKGGQIIFTGTVKDLKKDHSSKTGYYLRHPDAIRLNQGQKISHKFLQLIGATENNLKNIKVLFPLGQFICVTGVSGSGKSTLIVETLYHALMQHFNPYHRQKPGKYQRLEGVENIDKVILVDQSPIGRTPRSNPATYTGLFTYIRQLYASLNESQIKGYHPGRFSFNVKGGRCESCEGEGQIKIEMQFLADVYVICEVCHGARYNSETLEVKFKGKNIADILNMTVTEGLDFFQNIPTVKSKLVTLNEVGLSYIHLGQPATTLSGGEAQRIKLATELTKRQTGKTVYILDEPTTGLHFADLEKLLQVLFKLRDLGNTVIVIEHNLDVIKNADLIVDLGPEGGDRGGYVVAVETPENIIKRSKSFTGLCLRKMMN